MTNPDHFELYDDRADDIDYDALFAPEPSPAPVAPGLLPYSTRSVLRLARERVALFNVDSEFLGLVDPVALVMRMQVQAQLAQACAKGYAQTAAYQAAPGARNALRHTLHATGVL